MGVPQGHLDRLVAQDFPNLKQINPALNHEGCRCVPQIVEMKIHGPGFEASALEGVPIIFHGIPLGITEHIRGIQPAYGKHFPSRIIERNQAACAVLRILRH